MSDVGDICGPTDALIDEIAGLLGSHKLVPFFGAGVSRQQLGFAAAELAQEMAAALRKSSDTLLSELCDLFVDQFGEAEFISFLKGKLVLSTFDDAKVGIHRLLLSLSPGIVYTTNQDNLFELVAKNYGRDYRRVVTINDLSDAAPDERLLIKFHGDLDVPSSLVFGSRSYSSRMAAEDHPLDIKLRGDLLGKRLLFVGYSLRDENVSKLLAGVQRAFRGRMPSSYLLAFEYDRSMEELSQTFGIQIVNPRTLYPTAATSGEAFERCLKTLCDRTIRVQAERGTKALYFSEKTNSRMTTVFEVAAIAEMVDNEPLATVLSAFRAVIDHAIVPTSLHRQVTDMLGNLAARVDAADDDQVNEFKGALFNLHLPYEFALEALAHTMTLANRRTVTGTFDSLISIPCPALPDGLQPVAAAAAVFILQERNEAITDSFRRFAGQWFEGFHDLEGEMQETVKGAIAGAWPGSKAPDSPLNRPRFPMRQKGFHEMMAELQGRFPKGFGGPSD